MSRRNRPSAFDVSFPEEAEASRSSSVVSGRSGTSTPVVGGSRGHGGVTNAPAATSASTSHPQNAGSGGGPGTRVASGSGRTTTPTVPSKRTSDEAGINAKTPRARNPPSEAFYKYPTGQRPVKETADTVLPGEDDCEDYGARDGEVPVRDLTLATVFDRKHRNILVELGILETEEGKGREIVVTGYIKPYDTQRDDEDEGQEDGDDEDGPGLFCELSEIFKYEMAYDEMNGSVFLLTKFAWYRIVAPSVQYAPFYEYFVRPKRVAQMVLSTALSGSDSRSITFESFLAKFTNTVDEFGHTYVEQDLWDSVQEVCDIVSEHKDFPRLSKVPLIRSIFNAFEPSVPKKPRTDLTRLPPSGTRNQVPATRLIGNDPDNAVLRAEHQNATHVTPLIYSLAKNLVNESLRVVGARPSPPPGINRDRRVERVRALIDRARRPGPVDVRWEKADRVKAGSRLIRRVWVDGEDYWVGDVILQPNKDHPFWENRGQFEEHLPLPSRSHIPDFFWFGKIHWIAHDTQKAHIQWFEHGSGILLRELANDQHLYLTNGCENIDLRTIVGKVKVRYRVGLEKGETEPRLDQDEFICNFMFDTNTASFTTVEVDSNGNDPILSAVPPPDNCPGCLKVSKHESEKECLVTKDKKGKENGFVFLGQKYHLSDFVRYYCDDDPMAPANLGFIVKFELWDRRPTGTTAEVKGLVWCLKVGRVKDLGAILPPDTFRDERHVFITEEVVKVKINALLGVVFIAAAESLTKKVTVEEWVRLSPDHFYLKYQFPTMPPANWSERVRVCWDEHVLCSVCWKEKIDEMEELKAFFKEKKRSPLKVLDLFGGVGAFSDGLAQGSGALKVTHAIELAPSAARTFKHNFPEVTVYNQCANTMLQYTLKTWHGLDVPKPSQLYDEAVPVPPPPSKDDIQVITAGFPCQAHSSLNMYKNVSDVKNNLVLNALSWVDAIRPLYVYFENVPGFLSHRLKGKQAGAHKVEGGIEMGGLKIVVRALLDMGYQVRFALLQTANYGAPQRRVRFFIIATKHGLPLPDIPQPSHTFVGTGLKIDVPYALGSMSINPVRVTKGTALHGTVTLDDAIGDLARFDWKHPTKDERPRRQDGIVVPVVKTYDAKLKKAVPRWGPKDFVPKYHHQRPRTRFQLEARSRSDHIRDLQHFTKHIPEKRVARVIQIKMEAGADYRSLEPAHQEWQLANAVSAVARANFKPGMYGRLDKKGVFGTIVTNVDPTAKQSRVINPYCKRIVTVRELARGQGFPDHFEFKAARGNIVTMHRQIGNAVPYPLARALGRELRASLFKNRLEGQENAITIDDEDNDEDDASDAGMMDVRTETVPSDLE